MKTWEKKYEELESEMSEVKKSYEIEKKQILDRMEKLEVDKPKEVSLTSDLIGAVAKISKYLGVNWDEMLQVCVRVKSNSMLEMQDFRRFSEFGIPLVEKLSDKFTKLHGRVMPTQSVFVLINTKNISFNFVSGVLMDYAKELGGKIKGVSEPVANMMAENLKMSRRINELEKEISDLSEKNKALASMAGEAMGRRVVVEDSELTRSLNVKIELLQTMLKVGKIESYNQAIDDVVRNLKFELFSGNLTYMHAVHDIEILKKE